MAQQDKPGIFKPQTVSFYFGFGNEANIVTEDPDYLYKTNLLKASLYYKLNKRAFQLGLSIQPQVHFIEHQLLNEYFVRSFEENYLENRIIFTQLKSMQLYALAVELSLKRTIFKKIDVAIFLGVGPAIIDTQTERLAKGFTFIENLGIAISTPITNTIKLDVRPNFNHVSNAQIQIPNSGYNVLNLEIGFTVAF